MAEMQVSGRPPALSSMARLLASSKQGATRREARTDGKTAHRFHAAWCNLPAMRVSLQAWQVRNRRSITTLLPGP